MKTLGIVQSCHVGASQPEILGRKLGGKTLLEWVARRATDCLRMDRVIVLMGDSPSERELGRLLPPDIQLFFSPAADPLARFAAAIHHHRAKAAVRICADNPFVDPVLIDRLVTTADAQPKSDYISYCSSDGQPTIESPLGPFAEWVSADAIARANAQATRPECRQQVTRYIYSHAAKFQIRLLSVPSKLDRTDVRFRIDGKEDWEHIQGLCDALGHETWDWQHLAGLLDHHTPVRRRKALAN